MRSIAILGAGELGGALARQLAAADVAGHVVLVDDSGRIAEGKALDIRQAAPVDRYSTMVEGTTDESKAMGADAIVIADRASGAEWQDDAGVGLVRRLAGLNQHAMLLCAGAGQMEVVERGVREAAIPRHRLFGSAPEALRAAVVSMTALEAGCAPAEISLTIVGRPPGQIIVPWEEASIAGLRAAVALGPPAITRLDGRLPRLWPPGPITLAAAATSLLRAASSRGRQSFAAFVAASPDADGRERAGMLPITVTTNGIREVLAPSLSTRDRVRLETALQR